MVANLYFYVLKKRSDLLRMNKIEEVQKKIGKTVEETGDLIQEKIEQTYDDLIDRIKEDRDWIERTYDLKAEMLENMFQQILKKELELHLQQVLE